VRCVVGTDLAHMSLRWPMYGIAMQETCKLFMRQATGVTSGSHRWGDTPRARHRPGALRALAPADSPYRLVLDAVWTEGDAAVRARDCAL